jgi:dTDP-4-dehydrorhamnose reductase
MLGRALLPALAGAGHTALGLSRAEADVTQIETLRRACASFRPDWVVHLAAFTRVDDCEAEADRAFLVNGLGARNAAQAAAEAGASILLISTDYAFPGDGVRPYREYDPTGPRSVYGASKLAGEQAVREIHPRHVIVRTAWLFGAGGANFVDTVRARARAGEPLRVVDDQRGSPTSVTDLSLALVKLMAASQYGTYHCTNVGDCTWFDLAACVLELEELNVRLDRIDSAQLARPARRPAYSVLSNRMFEHVTGHRMPHWRDAVARYTGRGVPAAAARTGAVPSLEEGR